MQENWLDNFIKDLESQDHLIRCAPDYLGSISQHFSQQGLMGRQQICFIGEDIAFYYSINITSGRIKIRSEGIGFRIKNKGFIYKPAWDAYQQNLEEEKNSNSEQNKSVKETKDIPKSPSLLSAKKKWWKF